ncbi:hypothetical protein LY90DRAFT_698822 [Neocallimastix californiae]|uniref:Uncharacterized protein n=1 Tax=Neocallimastix californiae TaxID=1754190 RepID=A0A1Y2EYE4_9FUNG|nr:hypothetical protein LY90DRAFT_698822 [Neocallimastix californiae]|eukprot:ORY76126.1 hypothetical protein LY90DRAFT_698822 [Neocallimastix californiae]
MSTNFLKYYGSELEDNKIAEFKSIDGKIEKLEYKTIADSAYDQTFKRLFSWNLIIDDVKGEERLRSLLNSFFFPNVDENGYKIKEVIEIRNEKEYLGSENAGGKLSFDVTCRCICWKGERKEGEEGEEGIFDVEMQTSYESDFVVRLLEYGFGLRYDGIKIKEDENKQDQNEEENKEEKQKKDKKKRKKKKENLGNIIGTLDNPPVEVYAINLPYEIKKLSNNEPLIFNKKILDKSGVEWIKLLGLRHWATRDEHLLYHKYIIPKNTGDSNNVIQSAIRILEMINERDLKEFIKNEAIFLGQIKGAEEKGDKERKYKVCEKMLKNNEDMERIVMYTELTIEEITQYQEYLKRRRLN